MQRETKKLDFSNQKVFIGIDVHKKKWVITIRMNQLELKTYSMEPSPEQLVNYLLRDYPQGKYNSVYEAGFSGYWLDRKLKSCGINNVIVNPADIPTTGKEKDKKNDNNDSRKLARELENRTIKGIYIPEEPLEELRSLCRIRHQFVGEKARLKNRIRCYLSYYGKEFPGKNTRYWSEKLLSKLKEITFSTSIGYQGMLNYIEHFEILQEKVKDIEKQIRLNAAKVGISDIISKLETIPGIGFITAITLYTEIIDIKRFKKLDQLCSYVGLVPSTNSSGEKQRTQGLTLRAKKYLKNIIIEAAWIAVRKDPALTMCYSDLITRMDSRKAIIKIAKKLLNRIRLVWKNKIEYQLAVVK
jgi:transposase